MRPDEAGHLAPSHCVRSDGIKNEQRTSIVRNPRVVYGDRELGHVLSARTAKQIFTGAQIVGRRDSEARLVLLDGVHFVRFA